MSDLPLRDLRILIMEDEYLIAIDVEQLCHEHGASEVAIYRTLKDFDQAGITADKFNVAIVDVMLSGESTVDFARMLRSREIPFIFATGYSENETLFEAFPDVAVVGKPYAAPKLIEAIRAAVESGRTEVLSGGV